MSGPKTVLGDPMLDDVLAGMEIELGVEVELAKMGPAKPLQMPSGRRWGGC